MSKKMFVPPATAMPQPEVVDGGIDREKIELRLGLRNLWNRDMFSKSDAKVTVSMKDDQGKWRSLGETEEVRNNLNPDFAKIFPVEFVFERKQYIRFDVEDVDLAKQNDYIGYIEVLLGSLVGAVGGVSSHLLKNDRYPGKKCGSIVVSAQKVQESLEFITMQIHAYDIKKPSCMNELRTFFRIYQELPPQSGDSNIAKLKLNRRMIYESDLKIGAQNPVWIKFDMSFGRLCRNNKTMTLTFQFYNHDKYYGKHKLIGTFQTTLFDIINNKKLKYNLSKTSSTVEFKELIVEERPSFLDYVKGGQLFKVIVAIDFTASNGHVHTPASLHYINKNGKLNQYEQAIYEVCPIILNFDKDMQIPVYGFGGIPKFKNGFTAQEPQHIFPLTGDTSNPFVHGLEGIFDAYRKALGQVKLASPTHFSEIIECAVAYADMNQKNNSGIYSILLIITDGAIHDMDKTKDMLVQGSEKPLSVIIIGVGKDQFVQMKTLDCDNGFLRNKDGVFAKRDIVQFVGFEEFSGNVVRLAEEVLYELPQQFLDYTKLMQVKPKDPIIKKLEDHHDEQK